MSATSTPLILGQHDSLRSSLLTSIAFHGSLCLLVIVYGRFALHGRLGWGTPGAQGGAVRVNSVPSLPGIPLPSPQLATPNTLATENPELYQEQPKPKVEPPPEAEELPKFKDAVKPSKAERVNTRIKKETLVPPPHAIPTGEGGRPSLTYGQFSNAVGGGGLGFEEESFGDRYGWYVQAIRNRISSNWLMSTISPTVRYAERVYVSFDIQRDGTITNVRLAQSSGVSEIDRSALRAVIASNPLAALPQDYSGGRVSVKFYFDFRR